MQEKTKRQAWLMFLEQIVFCYIQCLLSSCSKIDKKKAPDAIQKLKDDREVIEHRFLQQQMSHRVLKGGVEVLEDMTTFFECSVDFISMPCEKLRRTQGKNFNFKKVTTLMTLRYDLTKTEVQQALAICKDVLDNYKEHLEVDNGQKKKTLFLQDDAAAAEAKTPD
jgi:HKD family nuclease